MRPYTRWLSEDYFIFHVSEAPGAPSAADLIRDHGLEIAQVVRGDRLRLSRRRVQRGAAFADFLLCE